MESDLSQDGTYLPSTANPEDLLAGETLLGLESHGRTVWPNLCEVCRFRQITFSPPQLTVVTFQQELDTASDLFSHVYDENLALFQDPEFDFLFFDEIDQDVS